MSIALVVLSLIYFFIFYRYFILINQIEKVFTPLSLPQEPNFSLGKIFAFIFLIYGIALLIIGISKKLDNKKKKLIFWISLVILFILGGRLLGGIALDSLIEIQKKISQ